MSRPVTCALVAAALLHAGAAHAVLGEAAASVQADQMRVRGARALHVALTHQVHEIVMADGSRIREFVSADGVVFAVAWNTRLKPDLQALLGLHHSAYMAAAREALRQPGVHRHVVLRQGDLVVHSSGHLNSFVGKAYVPSLVPRGTDLDAIR